MKICDSCVYFTKMKNLKYRSGICGKYDYNIRGSGGSNCQGFKPLKFTRVLDKAKNCDIITNIE